MVLWAVRKSMSLIFLPSLLNLIKLFKSGYIAKRVFFFSPCIVLTALAIKSVFIER